MNVLIGVISPAAIWVIPQHFVDRLRRDFPQHNVLEAWDRDAIRRLLPEADVAFTPFVDRLRRDFPQHNVLEAWDRDAIRRLLPEADVAFTPFVDRDVFPSATRLRWVQSPAVGVGSLMFPEVLASDVVITSARGIRARAIAEHVLGVT